MWNLGEPGSRFRAAARNHPETLLEDFKLLGKNEPSFFKGRSAPEISTIPDFFSLGCPRKFGGTFMWNLVEPQLLRVESLCGTWWNLNF